MTSTTLDGVTTGSPLAAPTRARAAVMTRVASYAAGVVREHRAVRSWRAQERALAGACGSELADLHALARRG
jgi:hypothetical protein